MNYYLPSKSVQKAIWGLAPGVALCAVSAVYEYLTKGADGLTASGLGVAFLTGAVLGLKNAFAHGWKPTKSGKLLGMTLCVIAVAATFSGCLSLTPYGPGALSSNNVKVTESTATENGVDTFALEIKSRGDAAAKTSVKYTGEAAADTTPWAFAVLGEANVESAARVLPLNEGAGAALAALPETLGPLVAAFNAAPAGEAGETIRDTILREIIQRVLARVTGGVKP